MASDVFTILFHGTGVHRDKDHESKEALHEITRMLVGNEYRDYLVCDGPGATPPKDDPDNPLAGSFDYASKYKVAKQQPMLSRYDTTIVDYNNYRTDPGRYPDTKLDPNHREYKSAFSALWLRARGLLMGEGMDDNLRHAIVVLAERFPTGSFTVNLLGWSRGGVSCIRAANWFYELFRERISVNIFAFDPVPGADLGKQLEDTHTLSPAVRNYVSVLCLHDRRSTFQPVDRLMLTLPPSTSRLAVALLPMPGLHHTPLCFAPDTGDLHAVPAVGRYLAWKFLKLHGTELRAEVDNPTVQFTPAGLCERYASMMVNLDRYGEMDAATWRNQFLQSFGRPTDRDVKLHRDAYLRRGNSRYFLNEHHVACFTRAFPALAAHLGVGGAPSARPTPMQRAGDYALDVGRLRRQPLSWRWLWSCAGKANDTPPGDWLPPAGLLAQHERPATNAPIDGALRAGDGLLGRLMEA